MDHSPADIIRQLFINKGLGTAPQDGDDWPVYASLEPHTPDNVITVYDTVGTDQGRVMIDGKVLGLWGFQIRVRAVDFQTGWAKIEAIRTSISEIYQEMVTLDAITYLVHAIVRIGNNLHIGLDANRRLFTLNAQSVI